jgi:hypothetical protein
MPIFDDHEGLRAYFAGYRKYEEWQEANDWRDELTPQQAIDAVSSIYRMLPPDSIAWNEQIRDRSGIGKLLETLALLR